MAVHNITLRRWDETFYFASIDAEDWLTINRPLEEGAEDEFQALLDGDGNMRPLRFARRWFSFQPHDAEIQIHCQCDRCQALADALTMATT